MKHNDLMGALLVAGVSCRGRRLYLMMSLQRGIYLSQTDLAKH